MLNQHFTSAACEDVKLLKITKFRQSCVVIEKEDGGRVLVDPGEPALAGKGVSQFGPVDAVLYTHIHYDHYERGAMLDLVEQGATVYGNADVAEAIGGDLTTLVDDGQMFEAAGFTVLARELEHMPTMNGTAGPPNTGFVFDGRCFHPGDGFHLAGLQVPVLLLPIAGPSVSFRDAYKFVEQTEAGTVIPIHYDIFTASVELFAARCDISRVIVLAEGESISIP